MPMCICMYVCMYMIFLDDIVEIQTVPGREWMALCGCKAESAVPNYWESTSGIPPDSIHRGTKTH